MAGGCGFLSLSLSLSLSLFHREGRDVEERPNRSFIPTSIPLIADRPPDKPDFFPFRTAFFQSLNIVVKSHLLVEWALHPFSVKK